jgi:hypothetical protein
MNKKLRLFFLLIILGAGITQTLSAMDGGNGGENEREEENPGVEENVDAGDDLGGEDGLGRYGIDDEVIEDFMLYRRWLRNRVEQEREEPINEEEVKKTHPFDPLEDDKSKKTQIPKIQNYFYANAIADVVSGGANFFRLIQYMKTDPKIIKNYALVSIITNIISILCRSILQYKIWNNIDLGSIGNVAEVLMAFRMYKNAEAITVKNSERDHRELQKMKIAIFAIQSASTISKTIKIAKSYLMAKYIKKIYDIGVMHYGRLKYKPTERFVKERYMQYIKDQIEDGIENEIRLIFRNLPRAIIKYALHISPALSEYIFFEYYF